MNKCNICHCNLGLFSKNKRIRDGYICDDCLKRSGINKPKIEITIKDVRNALYGDLPEPQKKAVPKASSHNDKDNVIDKYFRINKAAHRFSFGSGADYKYNQLVSYELLEDDETVTMGGNGVKRAVVGGILAGTAGAIVGASTAKNSSKQLANMLKIKVVIDPKDLPRTRRRIVPHIKTPSRSWPCWAKLNSIIDNRMQSLLMKKLYLSLSR